MYHSFAYAPTPVPRPSSDPNMGNLSQWQAYNNYQSALRNWNQAAPQMQIAKIMTAPAMAMVPAQSKAIVGDSISLAGLRSAKGQSTVLRARTENLKTTADVSQQVQQPVKAEAIKALPWVAGGAVSLILLGVILYRTKK
jgi:hypothetical protein